MSDFIKRGNYSMQKSIILPKWLDDYIFCSLGAKYCRSNGDMLVINWDKRDVLNYLGTYFPRSYCESYCILKNYISNNFDLFADKKAISVLDFGSGTGGEIIGMLSILDECYPNLQEVHVKALDGNASALRLFEKIVSEYKYHSRFLIKDSVSQVKIDDIYDLSIIDTIINASYDMIFSFKTICEFVSERCFDEKNPYCSFVSTFFPKLKKGGILLLEDVTTKNSVSNAWLPEMMDKAFDNLSIADRNYGHNMQFNVNHSHRSNDVSKVAWRITRR